MPNFYTSPLASHFADGAQVAATTTETILHPVFSFGAGDSRLFQGATFRLSAFFDISNVVTTPGTVRFRIRHGGAAGTVLADTGTIAMDTTARANFAGSLEALLVFRSIGSAGSAFCQGRVFLNNVPVAAAADPQGVYTMGSAGENSPAVVGSLDTTTAKDLAVTVQFSVNTVGTQITNHVALLEALHT